MHRLTRSLITATAAAAALLLSACDTNSSSQSREAETRQSGYDRLVDRQPAGSMAYSPTRETINAWIDTWDEPGKLAFVYIQNGAGYGYFVTVGPPVSYCAMLTPNYEIRTPYQSPVVVPAPGVDGAYYSGGQCNAYYAIDATTGAYLEFTIGANQSFFLYDQPMDLPAFVDATPLGPTRVDDLD
ncbi:hypothetical protein GCM10027160_29220 [Streptomyces calidiresistens]|uniref:Lipoprotein n=1 Tax=Streptomyces calidiresistens TaxID=1485586 RepID=A0A7W3XW82_9ACTN|nr:hypothetical protein [Streptomyces calidiresistens]MBB0229491.1 hypothetical protein [Streptomyces calidiresistens]